MVTENYLPTGPKDSLAHVAEECGELIAAIGKTFRFGPQSVNPEIPEDKREKNIEWVLREMDDVQMSIERFRKELTLDAKEAE